MVNDGVSAEAMAELESARLLLEELACVVGALVELRACHGKIEGGRDARKRLNAAAIRFYRASQAVNDQRLRAARGRAVA